MSPAIAELDRAVSAVQQDAGDVLSAPVALDELRELRQHIDRLESAWLVRVAAVHRSGAANAEGYVTTAAFLRHVCHFSPGAARSRVDVAIQLSDRPAIASAFDAGEISYQHAKVVIDALQPLPADLQADAEPVLIEAARSHDPGRVTQIARRIRHIVDPDGQAGIDDRHHEQRWFDVALTFEGNGAVRGSLDAEAAAVVRAAIDALSKPAGDIDPRTAAQRRADALVELARRSLDSADLPEVGGERPHVTVTVDIATLRRESTVPAELATGGLINAEAARRIACDAIVTRVTTVEPSGSDYFGALAQGGENGGALAQRRENDAAVWPRNASYSAPPWLLDAMPTRLRGPSQPLDVGRSSRTATAAIRKALVVRDRGCVMPGCNAPPSRCESHHIVHWADGGATAVSNMVLLCLFHHHFIHKHEWRVTLHPDATVTVMPPLEASA